MEVEREEGNVMKMKREEASVSALDEVEEILPLLVSYLPLTSFLKLGTVSTKYLGFCKSYLVSKYGIGLRWDLLDMVKTAVRRDLMTTASVWSDVEPSSIAPATALMLYMKNNEKESDHTLDLARAGMEDLCDIMRMVPFPTVDFFLAQEYKEIVEAIQRGNTNFYWYFAKLLYENSQSYGQLMDMWYIQGNVPYVARSLVKPWCPGCMCDLSVDLNYPIYLVCTNLCGCKVVFKKGENSMRNYINHTPVPYCKDCFYSV